MSAWDLEAANAFGSQGAIAFPGVDGYSRNLWDTTYDNWGPRVGAAYQINDRMVLRGGVGVTYLPANTGYFSGPTDYGSANFSTGVSQVPYGLTPAGVPVGTFQNDVTLVPAIGGDPNAAGVYGIGEARFDRDFKNGRVMQWNAFLERRLGEAFMVSIGYSASKGSDLLNRSFPIQSLQNIDQATLDAWRAQYIASNGTLNPATQQVANPFQPPAGSGTFAGPLAGATIPRQNTLFPYPLLIGSNAAVNRSGAISEYHSLILRASRRFSAGLMFDASYTFSREMDDTDTVEDNQAFNAGGNARGGYDILNPDVNRHIGFSDTPHRFVATAFYELPFGPDRPFTIDNGFLRAIARDWQVSGSVLWHTGFPVADQRRQHRRDRGPARPRPRRRPRAARQPAGLVRRPHDDHAAERASRHAAGEHLPALQPGRLRGPRPDRAERLDHRGPGPGTGTPTWPTTRSAPIRGSTST